MKITEDQKKLFGNLICERLTDNPKNINLIENFSSEKGTLIVKYFKENGLNEDKNNTTAFYVIKTKEDEILMFFSLKCGELFDFDVEELLIIQQNIINEKKTFPFEKTEQIIKSYSHVLISTKTDIKKEKNNRVSRVHKTFSGVQLVHFCSNDNMKYIWKKFGIHDRRTMGEVFFWYFIAPKFFEVQKIVGCEYAFLFAADYSQDGVLQNYYNTSLKFEFDDNLGVNKPLYDFSCIFMSQKLNDMKKNRENYFNNFNLDKNDILA